MTQYPSMQAIMLTKFASKSQKHLTKIDYILDNYDPNEIVFNVKGNYFSIYPVKAHLFPIEHLNYAKAQLEVKTQNAFLMH